MQLDHPHLTPNHALRNAISEWLVAAAARCSPASLSARELRMVLLSLDVDFSSAVEKSDLVALLNAALPPPSDDAGVAATPAVTPSAPPPPAPASSPPPAAHAASPPTALAASPPLRVAASAQQGHRPDAWTRVVAVEEWSGEHGDCLALCTDSGERHYRGGEERASDASMARVARGELGEGETLSGVAQQTGGAFRFPPPSGRAFSALAGAMDDDGDSGHEWQHAAAYRVAEVLPRVQLERRSAAGDAARAAGHGVLAQRIEARLGCGLGRRRPPHA